MLSNGIVKGCNTLRKDVSKMLELEGSLVGKSIKICIPQQVISKRFKDMGLIQMQGNRVSYELKLRVLQRSLNAC